MICRRSCVGGRSVWPRFARRRRAWKRNNGRRTTRRGRQPGQDRNPKGGPPYKRAYGEPDDKAQSNFTDPESSIMKTSSEGFQQCYNAQAAVDAEHQLVVATDLTANASDQGELPVLLDAVKQTFDAQPETVLADAGYCNERDLKDLEKRGIDGYVAPGREGKQTATRDLENHPATGRMNREAGRRRRAGRRMRSASGCRRLPTAGSSTRWASGASVYVDWRRCAASGTWCAWR